MKIYAINDYSNKDIVKKQISFKDMDGDPYISTPKTPYNRAMDNLDKVFCDKLNSLKAKYPDKTAKEYLKSLDKLWAWKEATEIKIKEKFGIIKKRNIFQKIFGIK